MMDKIRQAQQAHILEKLEPEDLYGQLAEEASELSQAALKIQRILLGRNPPAAEVEELMANLTEELSDICLMLELMELEPDETIMTAKTARWCERLEIADGREEGRQESRQEAE